jgi:hypothetical protein
MPSCAELSEVNGVMTIICKPVNEFYDFLSKAYNLTFKEILAVKDQMLTGQASCNRYFPKEEIQ